jgi:hypothetical protein
MSERSNPDDQIDELLLLSSPDTELHTIQQLMNARMGKFFNFV